MRVISEILVEVSARGRVGLTGSGSALLVLKLGRISRTPLGEKSDGWARGSFIPSPPPPLHEFNGTSAAAMITRMSHCMVSFYQVTPACVKQNAKIGKKMNIRPKREVI